jgi:signal transduction histidine kinase
MFQSFVRQAFRFSGTHGRTLSVLVVFSKVLSAMVCDAQQNLKLSADESSAPGFHQVITNAVQFRTLSGNECLGKCPFRLSGVITLVDTNRNIIVLQDETGAVALNFKLPEDRLEVGQSVSLEGLNCHPYIVSFPDYPYRPAGTDLRNSFEAPRNWGEYHLSRFRGFLHPPATGEYTFWIASDNSSELWLSTNAEPSCVRKIAFESRYSWVAPREWSKYPSQRSENIFLKAGQTYYIEALHEQTTGGDNLAVAWQGPTIRQTVIDQRYLTPWTGEGDELPALPPNGILRQYWTNYSAGNLPTLTMWRSQEAPFSMLSVRSPQVTVHGSGSLPRPDEMALNERMSADDNFRWVEAEGQVRFAGVDGNVAFLELSDGQAQIQVRVLHSSPELSSRIRNAAVRVEGVSEGVFDSKGILIPGIIWVPSEDHLSVVDTVKTNLSPITTVQTPAPNSPGADSTIGFYGTRGVVTFSDRVLNRDYIFVQEDTAAVFISFRDRHFNNELHVGEWVEVGGGLQPGKNLPTINPLVLSKLGWHSMPAPITQPVQLPVPGNKDGKWTEIEGVVRSLNPNGTVRLMGKAGPFCFWLGQTPTNCLSRYVDAKIRVRGVLSVAAPEAPLLLVPSRQYLDVEEDAPGDPFQSPTMAIADLTADALDPSSVHRVRLSGSVTYCDGLSFFIQDNSGGLRVQKPEDLIVKMGEGVEVVGFPEMSGSTRMLTDVVVRWLKTPPQIEPRNLSFAGTLPFKQSDTLVRIDANLLNVKTIGTSRVLELQEQQRVFQATLANSSQRLPPIAPGSRLRITGVCDNEAVAPQLNGKAGVEKLSFGSLNIWLRSPADVMVLRGPPWWTLKKTVTLVGALLTVLAVALLWVDLLRRRLERQRAAQLAFSQQILERLESERRRIAVNLHDSLGQVLLAIKNQALLAMQRSRDENELQHRLTEISGASSQAIEEVRQITHGLRPYQLDRLGLTQAIRATVERASANSPILFASRVEDVDSVFDKDSEIHVYRIVQEAVNNIVKHSKATEATVVIKKRADVISLSIRDNGQGFDPSLKPSSESHDLGYGLSGIGERVRILGGTLLIDSRPGEGTTVTVEVPIPQRRHDATSDNIDRG